MQDRRQAMASGQDIRITDVPFSTVPATSALVFINDNGKLRQTDLTTIAKYSELYTLIINAHNTALDELQSSYTLHSNNLNELHESVVADLQEKINAHTTAVDEKLTNTVNSLNATVSAHITNVDNKLSETISTLNATVSTQLSNVDAKLNETVNTINNLSSTQTAALTKLIDDGHTKLQQDVSAVDNTLTDVANLKEALVNGTLKFKVIDGELCYSVYTE